MKENLKSIDLGEGLGDIVFGMSREEIRKMLGEPTEIDGNPFDDKVGERTENWHYDELKLSLSFQEPLDWELDTISVTDPFYELNQQSLIGKRMKMVKAMLDDMDITDIEMEDHSDPKGKKHILLTSDAYLSNFWFDDGILKEIQWGPEDDV